MRILAHCTKIIVKVHRKRFHWKPIRQHSHQIKLSANENIENIERTHLWICVYIKMSYSDKAKWRTNSERIQSNRFICSLHFESRFICIWRPFQFIYLLSFFSALEFLYWKPSERNRKAGGKKKKNATENDANVNFKWNAICNNSSFAFSSIRFPWPSVTIIEINPRKLSGSVHGRQRLSQDEDDSIFHCN